MSDSLWPHGYHASLSFTISRVCSNSCSSSQWCHPTILSSVVPFSSCLQSSQHQGLFQRVISSHWVAKILELQIPNQSLQKIFRIDFLLDWLVWSPCCPRDFQESSLTPQFKSIYSLALCFLYGPISHSFLSTGKTIALNRQTFVGKVCVYFLICCLGLS